MVADARDLEHRPDVAVVIRRILAVDRPAVDGVTLEALATLEAAATPAVEATPEALVIPEAEVIHEALVTAVPHLLVADAVQVTAADLARLVISVNSYEQEVFITFSCFLFSLLQSK